MSDYSKLKELAEAVEKAFAALCASGGDELAEAWHKAEEEYSVASEPAAILTLIADLERHQRMLLAACMDMGAIGNALNADMNSDGEELLSLVLDLKADLEKEKTVSKGWYENWKGAIAERDQLKAERDNLREDRDGLLEAGAHLL